jgi:cell division protein ZapA
MTDRIIEIEIYGQKYKIRVKGEEDEKYISHLTSYVDQKMHEVAVKSKSVDALKIAVLAALNIADEYFSNKKKLDQLSEVIGHMESKIESLEDYLLKNGNTFKNIEEATKPRTNSGRSVR